MRIAVFNIDSLASNTAIRILITQYGDMIKLLGLSPPFRRSRGGLLAQSWQHTRKSGVGFSNFLACNFMLPRQAALFASHSATLEGLCTQRGIKVVRMDDANGEEAQCSLHDSNIDLIVCCYFDQTLRSDLIALPTHGIINVHSSLLPNHRGPMPVLYASLDKPPNFGVTVHAVNSGIDTGPILAQEAFQPSGGRTILGIMSDLHERGVGLLENVFSDIKHCRPMTVSAQSDGSYESFPSRMEITKLRRSGFRLFDRHDIARALRTPMSI